jgi:hypothetical protein
MPSYIYHSNGRCLAFLNDKGIFSLSGNYIGWVEDDDTVWDNSGNYRGNLEVINGNKYILKNRFLLNPIPKVPRVPPVSPVLPSPPAPIAPINLEFGKADGFERIIY